MHTPDSTSRAPAFGVPCMCCEVGGLGERVSNAMHPTKQAAGEVHTHVPYAALLMSLAERWACILWANAGEWLRGTAYCPSASSAFLWGEAECVSCGGRARQLTVPHASSIPHAHCCHCTAVSATITLNPLLWGSERCCMLEAQHDLSACTTRMAHAIGDSPCQGFAPMLAPANMVW